MYYVIIVIFKLNKIIYYEHCILYKVNIRTINFIKWFN